MNSNIFLVTLKLNTSSPFWCTASLLIKSVIIFSTSSDKNVMSQS